jgi:hypothetical protein
MPAGLGGSGHAQFGNRDALRHVGRLRHCGRDCFFSGFKSTATSDDARRTASPRVSSKEFASFGAAASRQLQANGRPVFVIGINNLGKQPVDFRVDQVEATQHVGASDYEMKIVTYEMLVQEEKNRQIAAAILTEGAAAGNAYSASQSGYGHYTTPSGRNGTFYSPTAAAIAQNMRGSKRCNDWRDH